MSKNCKLTHAKVVVMYSNVFKGIEYYFIGFIIIVLLIGYGLGKVF